MKFEIVEASADMAYDIAEVHIKSWQSAYKGIIPQSYLDSLSVENRADRYRFGDSLPKGHHFYAAKMDGEIIGLLHLCPSRNEDLKDSGEISSIYLLPEYWNKGYGGRMMEFSINTLSDEGYKNIAVWVLSGNTRAINVYKKYGFVYDGTEKTIEIGEKLTEVRYLKKLDATE